MKSIYLECECTHFTHLIRFSWFPDDASKFVYLETLLTHPTSLWARLKIAFKYVFGGNVVINDFVLGPPQLLQLKKILAEASQDLSLSDKDGTESV